jgi:hypothetical protein
MNRIVVVVAHELADQVRAALAPSCWDDLVEALIDELASPGNGAGGPDAEA